MRKLGISIYPDKSSKTDILDYIDRASKAGFSRIFSCLLSVNDEPQHIKDSFSEINAYAKSKGFEVILDVSPKVFKDLGISYQDLTYFNDIGADGIRLDMGFSGNEESLMTFNPYNLSIEINMSNDTNYVDTIMNYKPNKYNLRACHNFYPHNYSGLTLDHFLSCTARFNAYGLRTACFITSQVNGSFGPWPVKEGLPTLEMHRSLPLHVQLQHLLSLGVIDDIIISNCYPSDDELSSIANVSLSMLTLDVVMDVDVPSIEESIMFDELHFNRGDTSAYFIRSTQSRVKYKGHKFELFNAPELIKRGDVIIESSLYGHYAGELQIAKQDMVNSGMSNVVGHISSEELFLIDTIDAWQKFCLRKV
ncbi:MAG: MupG family TIM beta-alpha barrel fold protein [Erysipelotrichaceae bacterium]